MARPQMAGTARAGRGHFSSLTPRLLRLDDGAHRTRGHLRMLLDPAIHAVRSASIVLPEGANFHEAAGDALKADKGVAHASV